MAKPKLKIAEGTSGVVIVQVTFTEEEAALIDEMAALEGRSRTNYVQHYGGTTLMKCVRNMLQAMKGPPLNGGFQA